MDSSSGTATQIPDFYQNVVVMRHGDRIDNVEPAWTSNAARPWDPPLATEGRVRAFSTGRKFRQDLGFPIHRVFVSPFLRCVQTAEEAVTALSAVDNDPNTLSGDRAAIDPNKVKISVEYGLSEMMNRFAIRPQVIPMDGNWGFDVSEREAMLPAGTVDENVERVYEELPQWGESVSSTRARYQKVIKDLADKYPAENLLLVTHGEGVGVSLSTFLKDAEVYAVEYCAYVELRRPIFQKGHSFASGEFNVLTHTGQTGISWTLKEINQTSKC